MKIQKYPLGILYRLHTQLRLSYIYGIVKGSKRKLKLTKIFLYGRLYRYKTGDNNHAIHHRYALGTVTCWNLGVCFLQKISRKEEKCVDILHRGCSFRPPYLCMAENLCFPTTGQFPKRIIWDDYPKP